MSGWTWASRRLSCFSRTPEARTHFNAGIDGQDARISVPAIGCRNPDPLRSLFQRTHSLLALVIAGAGAVTRRNCRRAPAPVSKHVATARSQTPLVAAEIAEI